MATRHAAGTGRRRISVLCPTRLALASSSARREHFVERAIRSVRWQSVWAELDWEIVVTVDRGRTAAMPDGLDDVRVVEGAETGQAAAVNAAFRASTGDLIAVIEDDDVWHWRKIALQLSVLRDQTAACFVSANQMEVDPAAGAVRINDFATPSGWLMPREIWDAVGPLNEDFRWHVDNEWLGRLNALAIPRVHLVEQSGRARDLFATLVKRSDVRETEEGLPLVLREVHADAATARIARTPASGRQSRDEYHRMIDRFGEVPW
jgi:glycosyltransferase involved in cell wall biosynthesis